MHFFANVYREIPKKKRGPVFNAKRILNIDIRGTS